MLNPISNAPMQSLALHHSTSYPPASRKLKDLSSTDSTPSSPSLSDDDEDAEQPSFRVGLVIHRLSDGPAERANAISAYLELNRAALLNVASMANRKPGSVQGQSASIAQDRALVDAKASVGLDCLVGASARIGEKSTVKRCAIGSHCIIGKNARLVGCVLMEYCVIEDGYVQAMCRCFLFPA